MNADFRILESPADRIVDQFIALALLASRKSAAALTEEESFALAYAAGVPIECKCEDDQPTKMKFRTTVPVGFYNDRGRVVVVQGVPSNRGEDQCKAR